MSRETFEYHWGKHHRAYVDNLNKQIVGTELDGMALEDIVVATYNKGDTLPAFNNTAQATPRSRTLVCLALPRLYDPDPMAPALSGLVLLRHLSIVSCDAHLSLSYWLLLTGLDILVFDRVQIRGRARARRRHLEIYSEDIGASLIRTLL
ncbi:hypothetical protein Syun_012231 [Stephania yunnanensis]|uniref:superoxide dismutase n=1 Tax=Stephania yunnanensis TaxID=152371 RepID=A0AAP0JZ96_9MAGN